MTEERWVQVTHAVRTKRGSKRLALQVGTDTYTMVLITPEQAMDLRDELDNWLVSIGYSLDAAEGAS
jgi:hypothetical protein